MIRQTILAILFASPTLRPTVIRLFSSTRPVMFHQWMAVTNLRNTAVPAQSAAAYSLGQMPASADLSR